jgi:GTP-binding protein
MLIKTAKFIKGIVEADDLLDEVKIQIAFIGRSNVGKSSVINILTGQKGLARTSSTPGHTREINVFLINRNVYFVDLPGYGYTSSKQQGSDRIHKLINWYLFESGYEQRKIVLIIDANVGLTGNDLEMLRDLAHARKEFIIIANKVDKLKPSEYKKQMQKIQDTLGYHKVIPFSSKKHIGVNALMSEILG